MASLPNLSSSEKHSPQPDTHVHPLPTSKLTAIHRFKSRLTHDSSKNEIVFPPPSWFINEDDDASKPSISRTPSGQEWSAAKDTSTPASDVETETEETEILPEPTTFAMKIKQLIESLPIPASVATAVGLGPTIPTDKGPPIPEGVDERTARLLASENVMNGEPESQRQSVWAVLERMRHGQFRSGAAVGEGEEESVMMYSPLEPTEGSEVELAESELEYIDEVLPSAPEPETAKGKAPEPTPVVKKRWVPSTTKISVLTTWWGYRIYLPPPVMTALDASHLKAAKRAAMFAAALQWFLKSIPMVLTVMPPQMRAPVKLLTTLTPLVAYIGVFVAWSWTRIRKCDKGNGVVLSATWLLPVALMPMAWDAGDIQGPKLRPPTPVPVPEEKDGDKKGKGKGKGK
ncbi:hypothetical protein Hypma_016030 [Hypsizygus marmoreus]|uniref:Uncharacterized protein n=1 Tax=Hypsizygus marmoreus TaxID=39966 RepID=A0A369K3C7_HYPMA|nr:hypothetical protein Hypma_016030 [Hypsizygus marmoreus]